MTWSAWTTGGWWLPSQTTKEVSGLTLFTDLPWAQMNLCSLWAVHEPGSLNKGAEMLSSGGMETPLPDAIWRTFSHADVDLSAIEENS